MTDAATETNQALEKHDPALHTALSPLGRRVAFPPDIPFQAAEARGSELNATIGQITDGHGDAVRLPTMEAAFEGIDRDDLNRAFLYSPIEGIAETRGLWRQWQRQQKPDSLVSSLPIITAGLTHGLSIIADLFAGEGRAVAIAAPYWGNYRQIFATRTGARIVTAPAYVDGAWSSSAIADALADVPPGEPALAILNMPSNPGGYSPTTDERERLRESLIGIAETRPLIVVCDDAYAGLTYERDVPRDSPFWELVGAHQQLVPVKVDGATKEFSFFGGRVGFLTFAHPPDSPAAAALESKIKCLIRATIGSPVSASQMVLLQALRNHGIAEEVESVRRLLERRYRVLSDALRTVDRAFLRPLPFNSGCFALIELPDTLGLDAETIRRGLLERESTGLVALPPRHLRIAFCSVDEADLGELVRRIERGVKALAAA